MKFWDDKISTEDDDFSVSWGQRLQAGETITAQSFVLTNAAGLSVLLTSRSGTITTVRLGGGTKGRLAKITAKATTNTGRHLEEEMGIAIV